MPSNAAYHPHSSLYIFSDLFVVIVYMSLELARLKIVFSLGESDEEK